MRRDAAAEMQWCTTEFSAIGFMSTAPEGFGLVQQTVRSSLSSGAHGERQHLEKSCDMCQIESVYSILVAQLAVQLAAQLARPGIVVGPPSGTVLKTDHGTFLKTDHIHHTHSTHSPHTHTHTHSVFFFVFLFL